MGSADDGGPAGRAGALGPATWTEMADRRPGWLLVPLGSTEQHGPHLPLDTDTRIGVAWAEGVARTLEAEGDGSATVAPALPYGSSGEHQGFAGTLSIGRRALELVLVELVRSVGGAAAGVALLSAHAGNLAPLTSAAERLRMEGHRVVALVPSWEPDQWPADALDAHAGRTETSLLLHLAPELVRTGRAEAGATDPLADLLPRLRRDGLAAVTANGVLGDPAGASAGEGRALLDDLVTRTVAALRSAASGCGPDTATC